MLPDKVIIPLEELDDDLLLEYEDEVTECISEYLSENYCYCIFSYDYEIKDKVVEVTNIEWDTTD